MAQIKIYGVKEHLDPIKAELSNVIHSCVVDALSLPRDKRANRFFPLEPKTSTILPDERHVTPSSK